MRNVRVGEIEIGEGRPLVFILGPCVIESREHSLRMAEALARLAAQREIPVIYKSSFDKANRQSLRSFRGPGMEEGLRVLAEVREASGLPVLTDIHEPAQAAVAAEVVDVLQTPAFLCRQTDLLVAAGRTGKPVNIKKGQFLHPEAMAQAAEKVESGGGQALLCERGTTFGYNNLVVDMRSLAIMRALGRPVIFDATHSVQLPGAAGAASGGQREFVPVLARAAVAAGVDGIFMEVHDDPDNAPCDGPNMIPLDQLPGLIDSLLRIREAV